ncbi:MAG TPA: hypothetical protein VK985_08875 [Rariglobus sp.]|nr:hypothetical protein [Rariglobus sp.]
MTTYFKRLPGRIINIVMGRHAYTSVLFVVLGLVALQLDSTSNLHAQEKKEQKGMTMRGNKPYQWWYLGEAVTFKPGPLPDDLKTLEGVVFDVSDNYVATVLISREKLDTVGWEWTPKETGFYDIEFSWFDAAGQRTDIGTSFGMKAPNGTRAKFERKRMSVAVTKRPDANAKHTGQFGFHYHLDTKEIPLAKLIGYDFAFIHSIPWGTYYTMKEQAIEPERGVYNWNALDTSVKALVDAKFEIAAQFLYTPAWASPHPELADKIAICLPVSSAYAPVNMDDFTNFVELTVKRYKDHIKIWEIWNEPNMPNGSIYWFDTPENYVKLLQAGYKSVKKVQPEAQVWNGGIGMRLSYHAFYDQMLQNGAAPFYDKLSLHGVSTDVSDFRRIEKENNAPHKEALMTEWHAILVGNMSAKLMDSEAGLSMRMMRDQLSQIKQGVTKTVMFEITNQMEKETINFSIANNWFTHSSGLFRRTPRIEPRHPALVMAVFIDAIGKKASFIKEVVVGKEGYGLLLSTGKGNIVALWSDQEPIKISDLKKLTTNQSVLSDWEGKTVQLNGAGALDTNKIYYLSAPSSTALSEETGVDRFIPPNRIQRTASGAPSASFVAGKIVDSPITDRGAITSDWKYTSLIKQDGAVKTPEAKALVGVHEDGIDVVVQVRDPIHVQNESGKWWQGDSVQLGIDCEGRGLVNGNIEVIAALKPDGVVFWKLAEVNAAADLPAKITPVNAAIQYGDCKITREGDLTIYKIRLPWSELYPMAYNPKQKLKLSLVINNNDGKGRAGYLEWGGGIGSNEKDPLQYGTLQLIK